MMESNQSKNKTLYRNPKEAKMGGVCAGLADYFEIDVWLVRILAVTGLIFMTSLVFVAYWLAYFMLDPKPIKPFISAYNSNEIDDYLSSGYGKRQILTDLRSRFTQFELRVRRLEKYITSSEFQLRRELSELTQHKSS